MIIYLNRICTLNHEIFINVYTKVIFKCNFPGMQLHMHIQNGTPRRLRRHMYLWLLCPQGTELNKKLNSTFQRVNLSLNMKYIRKIHSHNTFTHKIYMYLIKYDVIYASLMKKNVYHFVTHIVSKQLMREMSITLFIHNNTHNTHNMEI